jgi:hypothetical protein
MILPYYPIKDGYLQRGLEKNPSSWGGKEIQ